MTQLTIKKNKQEHTNVLWWEPFLAFQRGLNHAMRNTYSFFTPAVPSSFWDTEEHTFDTFQRNTHRVFSELFNNRQMVTPWLMGTITEPYIDIIENDHTFKIKADVPGVNEHALDVEIADDAIIISGTHREELSEEEDTYLRRECHSGTFSRTIALPEEADVDNASASLRQNVLTVEVPKKAATSKQDTRADNDDTKQTLLNMDLRQSKPSKKQSKTA